MAQNNIHHHIAHSDEYLIAENRKTFLKVLGHKGAVPLKVPGKRQDKGNLFLYDKGEKHRQIHDSCQNRSQSCARSSHTGKTEFAEDQQIVEDAVGDYRGNAAVEGNPYLFDGPQKGAHGHGKNLERVGKAHDL